MFVATLWIAVLIVAGMQLVYTLIFFRHILRMRDLPEADPAGARAPVSVIICAHNEASNLRSNLPGVLSQDYHYEDGSPAFEVVVVNDASTDDSAAVLAAFAREYPQLRVLELEPGRPRSFPGKKFPLSQGLAGARHGLVLCTDADCAPGSNAWLKRMVVPLQQGKEIVAGYGGIIKTGSRLNWFVRYETIHTFLQYYSFCRAGLPYMAVGRNLAASRALFLRAQAHPAWSKLPSGDDDLLIQLCATADNMVVVSHPEAFTWSAAKERIPEYLAQKRRHVSTGKFYSLKTNLAIGAYALLQTLWWVLLALILVAGMHPATFLVLLLTMGMHSACLWRGSRNLQEQSSIPGWMGFFFCWMLYNAVLAPYILWKSKQRWK